MNNILEKFKLKKFLLLLVITILCCGVFVIHRTVAEDTTPGNPAFEDYNFYKLVIDAYNENHSNVDYNHNLTDSELQSITKISSDQIQKPFTERIYSIKGIEKLTNLEELDIRGTYITTIDLSQNKKLVTLSLENSRLTSLDLSNNNKIKSVDLTFGEIETINISQCELLENLDVMGNNLEELDVTANKNLKSLSIGRNKLTSIDLTQNTNLETFLINNTAPFSDGEATDFSTLNLENNTKLKTLSILNDAIDNIDLTHNKLLESLTLHNVKLKSININLNTQLKELDLSYNHLKDIDISKNVLLTTLDLERNQLNDINISKNSLLTTLYLDNNLIENIDISNNLELDTFRIGHNKLTSIDVTKHTKLRDFDISINPLLSLNISNNPKLSNGPTGRFEPGLGIRTFKFPNKQKSYQLDLTTYDSRLEPSKVQFNNTANVTYNNITGVFTINNNVKSITYNYQTDSVNPAYNTFEVQLTLEYPIAINNFYIGNTANDVYTNTRNVKVNLTWEEENITHYCISTENSSEHCEWKEVSNQNVSSDYTLTSGDGEKILYAFIKNSDGLISNAKSDSITLDTTKPVVQSVYIGGSNNPVYATNTSSNIYFTYQDSDVASYCIKDTNDSSNCTWNNVTGNTMNVSYTLTSNNGSKVVYVFLKDRAGNISLGKEDTIILDTINPTIDKFYIGGSNNPDVITDTNTSIYLSWQDDDVASYCIKTENNISNCVWNNVNGKSINASYNIDEVNGTKTLYAFIKDKAGLVSSVKSDNVLLDSKKPVVDIFYIGGRTNPEEIGDTNTIVYLKWSDTDVVKYCINTENNANNCTWNNTSNKELEVEYILPGVNGLRTLYAFLKDSSGLISNGKSDTITLNSTKPLIKSFAINNNAKYTTNKEISYKLITEENNIVSYCINTVNSSNNCNWITNSNQEINGKYTLDNNDGNKTLYVYLKNNLDVISNVASDSIILDTTKPIIDEFFIGGVNNPTYINNKNTTIYSVFKDLDVVSYCINTINDSNNCTWNNISSNKINTNYTISNNDGNITLYLFLKDEAGLISNSKSDNVILDTEKPTVKDFYFGNTTVNNEKVLLEITITEDDVISYCVSDKNNSNNCNWKEVTSKNIKEEYMLTGGNGEKSIYVYLKDKAGNITSSKELKITLQKSNVGSSVDNNLNENEADKPLNNSPQTGSLEISILIILLAITSIYCFIKFKKKNYIFKV